MTAKQLSFVDEYLIDLCAAGAARRAGYSARTARVIGYENLTKPDIAAAIAALRAERRAQCAAEVAGAVEVLRGIAADPKRSDRARIEAVRLLLRRLGEDWADPRPTRLTVLLEGSRRRPAWFGFGFRRRRGAA